jgi:hypothetical protein
VNDLSRLYEAVLGRAVGHQELANFAPREEYFYKSSSSCLGVCGRRC